jgi:hypothetical protein
MFIDNWSGRKPWFYHMVSSCKKLCAQVWVLVWLLQPLGYRLASSSYRKLGIPMEWSQLLEYNSTCLVFSLLE